MRRVLASAVLGVGLVLAGSAVAAQQPVVVANFSFDDASPGDDTVVVNVGDQIKFVFPEAIQHSATVDGLFDSEPQSGGETWTTKTLTKPGTYTLYCTVHKASRHSATLLVRGSTTSPPPKPSPTKTATATSGPTAAATASPSASTAPTASTTAAASGSPTASPSGDVTPSADASAGAQDVATTPAGGSGGSSRLPLVLLSVVLAAAAVYTVIRARRG